MKGRRGKEFFASFCIFIFAICVVEGFLYEGYEVVDIKCENIIDYVEIIKVFEQVAEERSEILSSRKEITLLLSPTTKTNFLSISNQNECQFHFKPENFLKTAIKATYKDIEKSQKLTNQLSNLLSTNKLTKTIFNELSEEWFEVYHDYDSIVVYLQSLNEIYPSETQILNIGSSYENRTIYGIRLSGNNFDQSKQEFIFNGCQHAREWISFASSQFIIINYYLFIIY